MELLGGVLLPDVLNALIGWMTGTSEIEPHKQWMHHTWVLCGCFGHLTVLPANCAAGHGADQLFGVCSNGLTVPPGRTSCIGNFPAMVESVWSRSADYFCSAPPLFCFPNSVGISDNIRFLLHCLDFSVVETSTSVELNFTSKSSFKYCSSHLKSLLDHLHSKSQPLNLVLLIGHFHKSGPWMVAYSRICNCYLVYRLITHSVQLKSTDSVLL